MIYKIDMYWCKQYHYFEMSRLPMIIFTLHRTWTSNSNLARDFTLSEGFSFGPFQSGERINTIERSSWLSLIPHFSTIPHHPSSSSTVFFKNPSSLIIPHFHLLFLCIHIPMKVPWKWKWKYTYPPPSSLIYLNEQKTSTSSQPSIWFFDVFRPGVGRSFGQSFRSRCQPFFCRAAGKNTWNDVLVKGICQAIILICFQTFGC